LGKYCRREAKRGGPERNTLELQWAERDKKQQWLGVNELEGREGIDFQHEMGHKSRWVK